MFRKSKRPQISRAFSSNVDDVLKRLSSPTAR